MEFDSRTGFLKFEGAVANGAVVATVDLSDETINKLALKLSMPRGQKASPVTRARDLNGRFISTNKGANGDLPLDGNKEQETANDSVNNDNKQQEVKATAIIDADSVGQVGDAVGEAYAESAREISGVLSSTYHAIVGFISVVASIAGKAKSVVTGDKGKKVTANDSVGKKDNGRAQKRAIKEERADRKREKKADKEQIKLDKDRNRLIRNSDSGGVGLAGIAMAAIIAKTLFSSLTKGLIAGISFAVAKAVTGKRKQVPPDNGKDASKKGSDTKGKAGSGGRNKVGASGMAVGALGAAIAAKEVYDVYSDDSISPDGKDGKKDRYTEIAGGIAGGISGSVIGSAIGTAIVPVVGTAIGFALGGIAGYFGGRIAGDKAGDVLFSGKQSSESEVNKKYSNRSDRPVTSNSTVNKAPLVKSESPIERLVKESNDRRSRKDEEAKASLRKYDAINSKEALKQSKQSSLAKDRDISIKTDNKDIIKAIEKLGDRIENSDKSTIIQVERDKMLNYTPSPFLNSIRDNQ